MRTTTPLMLGALTLTALLIGCATTPESAPSAPIDSPAPQDAASTPAPPPVEEAPVTAPEEPERSPQEKLVEALESEVAGKHKEAVATYESLCPDLPLACSMQAFALSFGPEDRRDISKANAVSPLFFSLNSISKPLPCKRTAELINARFDGRNEQMLFCFQRALLLEDTLSGELYFDLIFSPDGSVSHISSNKEKDTLSSAALNECAGAILGSINICKGGSTAIHYPYLFETHTKTVIKRRKR